MKNKREFQIFALIFSLIIFSSFVSAGHAASEIKITIDGTVRSLEYAVNNNIFTGVHAYSSASPSMGQHSAENIWVSTDSGEMTLLSALTSGISLKKTSFTSYSSYPTGDNVAYHLATDIDLATLGKTFQEAINAGNIACVTHSSSSCSSDDLYWYNSCGAKEDLKQDCGSDYTTDWTPYWGCGSDGNLHKYKYFHDLGCSSGACFDTISVAEDNAQSCGGYGCAQPRTPFADAICHSAPLPVCGNGACESGETCSACKKDCGACPKIICSELYNTGVIDEETYGTDLAYSAKYLSEEALKGYHAWAIPVVESMRNSKEDRELVTHFTEYFLEEVKFRMGKKESGNEIGKILLDEGVPLFERIGVLIDIVNIFNKKRPLIYKIEEGKYIIDLTSTLSKDIKDLKEIRDPKEK